MNLGWALYQREINILKDLDFGHTYKVKTIVTGRQRIFTYRDYFIYNEKGDLLVESSSVWILFDLNKRSFVSDYPEEFKQIIDPGNELPHLPRPQKIRLKSFPSPSLSYSTQVRYSEIDINGHLSNHHQNRYLYDVFSKETFELYRIKSFKANYLEEANFGDLIAIEAFELSKNIWMIQSKSANRKLALAQIEFEVKA